MIKINYKLDTTIFGGNDHSLSLECQYMDDPNIDKNIIIVEDDANLADIYKTRLELIGYTCFIAYNGITALYFIQKEIPDLVLLDLMIPDIGGGQVLETMRNGAWGKDIKVLVISNLNESEAPSNLRQLGIEEYLVKANLSNDQIDQAVNNILRPLIDVRSAAAQS